ncbi:uncharacterized protein N7482_002080 [Penicillium canariense]|uniref:Uncharacterized protein n=1 Tax=Penicillium canariense TaxID=189055 RepID=A0A9W9IGC4_9EURO|nr:uncharacterized protein N7482_002080 [Penicillium canariense]KAJ5176203.1 hypothetical protein N7482_002080 [Penicillium canariense]
MITLPTKHATTEHRPKAGNDVNTILDSVLSSSDPELTTSEADYIDWYNPDIDLSGLWSLQGNETASQSPLSGWSSLEGEQLDSLFNISIPAQPTANSRSLIMRPNIKTGAHGIANLILHTLKSYLLMMLRHSTLPPFIHPRTITRDFDKFDVEPLTNCISLMHILRSEIRGSRKLFWKNVRLECERLLADHPRLSDWELLAGKQAISIYILIRLDEGATEQNNFDPLLLATVAAISKQLKGGDMVRKTQLMCRNGSLDTNWEDWIFEESERRLDLDLPLAKKHRSTALIQPQRLCVIHRVVNLLVYFDPAAICDMSSEFVIAPLPAKKQLWEASDELTWRTESKKAPKIQTCFGLAKTGKIKKLHEVQPGGSDSASPCETVNATTSESAGHWEEWCSGMDSLGGIVMLAASLIV